MDFDTRVASPLKLDVSVEYYRELLRGFNYFESELWEHLTGSVYLEDSWRRVSFWVDKGTILGVNILDLTAADTFCGISLAEPQVDFVAKLNEMGFKLRQDCNGITLSDGKIVFSCQSGRIVTIGWGAISK